MRLTLTQAIDARWTHLIHDEWTRNAARNHPKSQPAQWQAITALMNLHANRSLVTGFEHSIDDLDLPDANDRHVLAAAIRSRATAIITFNLKDFPEASLQAHGIKAIHPDDFLLELIASDLKLVLRTLKKQRGQLSRPAMTALEFIGQFSKHQLPRSAEVLLNHVDSI